MEVKGSQWQHKEKLFVFLAYRGWNTTQSNDNSFTNHEMRIPLKTTSRRESKRVFFPVAQWILISDRGWFVWFWWMLRNFHKWVFPKIVVPKNGWFIMETPIKMDDLGVPPFKETPKYSGPWLPKKEKNTNGKQARQLQGWMAWGYFPSRHILS